MAVINMGPQDLETMMPIHLPMKVNKENQGPIDDSEKGPWACWCSEGFMCEEVWEYWDVTPRKVEE